MRLIVDRALFEVENEREALDLASLLSKVARDEHHALLTAPPFLPGGDNGPLDVWLASQPRHLASAFRTALENGLVFAAGPRGRPSTGGGTPLRWNLAGSLEIRVGRRTASDWKALELTLSDAVDLLLEPVHLVLENARTDLAFVSHLAGTTNGASLRRLLDVPGCIQLHGGGSGEVKKWLEALLRELPRPAAWRRMLRAWVLFDNDAGNLDAREPSSGASKLMGLCEDIISQHGRGLSWIWLCRREIESYIPDSGLREEALAAHNGFVEQVISWRNAPSRMSWAWALDLKKGLRGDLRDNLPETDREALKANKVALQAQMLKAPFSGLSPAEVSTLDRGMSDRLGKALLADPERAWTLELPAEYDRGPSTQVSRLSFVQSLFDRM